MKRLIIVLLLSISVLFCLISCQPAITAGQSAATEFSNNILCDAEFKATVTGFYFDPLGSVENLFIVASGDIESSSLELTDKGLYEAFSESQSDVFYASVAGRYVATASYTRGGVPRGCVLE